MGTLFKIICTISLLCAGSGAIAASSDSYNIVVLRAGQIPDFSFTIGHPMISVSGEDGGKVTKVPGGYKCLGIKVIVRRGQTVSNGTFGRPIVIPESSYIRGTCTITAKQNGTVLINQQFRKKVESEDAKNLSGAGSEYSLLGANESFLSNAQVSEMLKDLKQTLVAAGSDYLEQLSAIQTGQVFSGDAKGHRRDCYRKSLRMTVETGAKTIEEWSPFFEPIACRE